MRDIRNIVSRLGEGDQSNFGLVKYIDTKGEERPMFSLGDDKVRTKKYYKWTELGIKWLREKFGFDRYFDYNLVHNDYSDEE